MTQNAWKVTFQSFLSHFGADPSKSLFRARRIGANIEKSDLVNFRGPDWRKFSELSVLLFFLGKTDKMLPKSRFSKPIFGHSAGSTKLDRPHCKRFWTFESLWNCFGFSGLLGGMHFTTPFSSPWKSLAGLDLKSLAIWASEVLKSLEKKGQPNKKQGKSESQKYKEIWKTRTDWKGIKAGSFGSRLSGGATGPFQLHLRSGPDPSQPLALGLIQTPISTWFGPEIPRFRSESGPKLATSPHKSHSECRKWGFKRWGA